MEEGNGNEFGINHALGSVPSPLEQQGWELSGHKKLKSHRFLPLEGAWQEQMHCKQSHTLNNSQ